MHKTFFPIVTLLVIGLLSGCASRALNPSGEKVRIIPYTPNNCKFMGEISENNVHGDMSLSATQQELTIDHTNFMKNAAAKMGANTVVFTKPEIEEHTRQINPKMSLYRKHTAHNINAKAYLCSPR